MGGPQGLPGQSQKILSTLQVDAPNAQPIARCYTDHVILGHQLLGHLHTNHCDMNSKHALATTGL